MPIGRKKKALVHIAKEDLRLDEESYRQILKGVAGVESSTRLTEEGFENVMKRFQEMGFKGLLPHPFHLKAWNRSPRTNRISSLTC
jgi:phage gp16-like protein